jgi:hypothetical protein
MEAIPVPGQDGRDVPGSVLPGGRALAALLALAVIPYLSGLWGYYIIDDGLSVRLGQRVVTEGWHVALSFEFNGHFRPLPIACWAGVYALSVRTRPFPTMSFP